MKGLKAILELLKNILNEGDIHYIGGAEPLPPPLDKEEEAVLLKRLDLGDEDAKRELIERNLRLVVYIARRFDNTGIGTEDLVSIGSIGLIKAISTFNTGKNIKLATYASRCIENEILMYLRKSSNQRSEISLDEPLNTDWDGNELLLSELLGTDDDIVNRGIESEAEKKILTDAVTRLGARAAHDHEFKVRARRERGAHAKRGRRYARHIAKLYFKAGEENTFEAEKGHCKIKLKGCFICILTRWRSAESTRQSFRFYRQRKKRSY